MPPGSAYAWANVDTSKRYCFPVKQKHSNWKLNTVNIWKIKMMPVRTVNPILSYKSKEINLNQFNGTNHLRKAIHSKNQMEPTRHEIGKIGVKNWVHPWVTFAEVAEIQTGKDFPWRVLNFASRENACDPCWLSWISQPISFDFTQNFQDPSSPFQYFLCTQFYWRFW